MDQKPSKQTAANYESKFMLWREAINDRFMEEIKNHVPVKREKRENSDENELRNPQSLSPDSRAK